MKINYLSNENILEQIRCSKATNVISDQLAESLMLLVKKIISKSNWKNYPPQVKDELMSNAICDLVESWFKFNEEKSSNPFAYFTSIVFNSFKRTINKEKTFMNFKTFLFQTSEQTTYESYCNNVDGDMSRWIGDEASE